MESSILSVLIFEHLGDLNAFLECCDSQLVSGEMRAILIGRREELDQKAIVGERKQRKCQKNLKNMQFTNK